MALPHMDAFYGGAGGGGKSFALLAGALQFVDVPGYQALLLRRNFPQLSRPDGLIPLSHQWLQGTRARWSEKLHQWLFPSGATLTFGHLEHENIKYDYAGPSFQYIGFDELTGFTETMFRFLFSRLRKLANRPVPLRMRSASNPGGEGHEWVRQRYIVEGRGKDRIFVPAKLADNPSMDAATYRRSLAELDPVTRAQIEEGDWNIRPEGKLFKRAWFAHRFIDRVGEEVAAAVRYWDLAATTEEEGKDPDYAAGCLMIRGASGTAYIADVKRQRGTPGENDALMLRTARRDGVNVRVCVEQEPGSSGKIAVAHYRQLLEGFDVRADRPTGDKVTRCGPLSSAAEAGNVYIVRGAWNGDFLDELCAFDGINGHDDQVDAATGAHKELTAGNREWTQDDWSRLIGPRQRGEPGPMERQRMLMQQLRGGN